MEKELNELLKHALTPTDEPDFRLNQRILSRIKETENPEAVSGFPTGRPMKRAGGINMDKRRMRRPSVILAIAVMLGTCTLTAFATWKYLTSEKVAEKMQDAKLAEAFLGEDAVPVNETQSYGGYAATLISVISGEALSDYTRLADGAVVSERTYAVVAIEKSDGTPMPDSEGAYSEMAFFVSPLIGGYNPAFYNAASMHGNYTEFTEDGILYRLVECDNVEIFADHNLYLCVCEGTFYDTDAYAYDRDTGEISRNEEYGGLNALFDLKIDPSKAQPDRAAEYLGSLGITEKSISEEKREVELDDSFKVEIAEGNEKGAELAEYALQFVGNPYEWGGESLTEGTDCSGFTMSIYAHFGIYLPHAAQGQAELGVAINSLENAQPGDLLFYENPAHVAIYIGDGKAIHADPGARSICVSEADYDEIMAIRRILEAE